MAWDSSQPVTNAPLLSAPVRANFQALDAAVMAALTALVTGQVLVKGATGIAGVAAGTTGQVLTLVAGLPAWAASTGGAAVRLLIESATLPDGTGTGNNPPELQRNVGAQLTNGPKITRTLAAFDAATDEHLLWTFILPANYGSGGTLRLKWTTGATTGNVVWKGAGIGGPAGFAAVAVAAPTAAPGVAGTVAETLITLTSTSFAANLIATVMMGRDADDPGDTAAGDVYLWAAQFEYTAA